MPSVLSILKSVWFQIPIIAALLAAIFTGIAIYDRLNVPPTIATAPMKPPTETGSIKKRRKVEPELQLHTQFFRWLQNDPTNDDTRCDTAHDKRPFWCSERP